MEMSDLYLAVLTGFCICTIGFAAHRCFILGLRARVMKLERSAKGATSA